MNAGNIKFDLTINTEEAEKNLDRLIEKLRLVKKPWWCPPFLYRWLGN